MIKILSQQPDSHSCEISIENLGDCQNLAQETAKSIQVPVTIALSGTLGAGKTQWTRFFAEALGAPGNAISSPTFMLVHEYPSEPPIFHLDAYRVGDEEEMLDLGIEEMFDQNAVTIVEWADRFPRLWPINTLHIHIDLTDCRDERRFRLQASGQRAQKTLAEVVRRIC